MKATENARPSICVNNNPATSIARADPIVAKRNADILIVFVIDLSLLQKSRWYYEVNN